MTTPDPPPHAPLEDALTRAVSTRPWWRRWRSVRLPVTRPPGTPRAVFPALAALGAVLVLSLLGIAAPWDSDPTAAQGGGALEPDGPVLLSPPPTPVDPPPLTSRFEAGQSSPAPPGQPCPPAVSVAVSADIAPLVRELAGPLAGGACPQVTVDSQGPAGMAGPLAYQGGAGGAPDADVWIPASSLSLRLAGGDGAEFPASGEPIARSPIVIALPEPVHDTLTGFPVWIMIYNETTAEDGLVPRMSMPDHRTTVGALAQVTLQAALLEHTEGDEGPAFLALMHFRGKIASTGADVGGLLDRLARSSPDRAGTEVGAFPATEQQLVAYHRRGAGVPVVPMGTYDANIEADYPMAVARSLDDRRAAIAAELRDRLRSPEAVRRLVAAGFRPPGDPGLERTSGFPAGYPNPFPTDVDYPKPVPLPTPATWRRMVEDWTWQG